MDNDKKTGGQNRDRILRIVRYTVVFLIIVGGSFLFLGRTVSRMLLASNTDAMRELSLHDLNSIKNSIVLRWENMEGAAKTLSRSSLKSAAELFAALKNLTADIPSAAKLCLLDADGTAYFSTGVVSENSYLQGVCEGKTERFVVRLNAKAFFVENERETLFAAVPVDITLNGKHFHWFLCQFPINTLESELKIDSYNGEGYSSLIDAEGYYIINVSQNHSFLTYDNFFSDFTDSELQDYGSPAEFFADAADAASSTTYTKDGREYIMVALPFKLADWYFISTVPVSVFARETRMILSVFLLLLAIACVILLAVFLLVLRHRKQQAELTLSQAANKSKTEFLFNMSHDIRTPMNAILGFTDIALKHHDEQDKVDDSLKKIKLSGEHLLHLINDILEMSRIESGKLDISENPMDIRKLIEGVKQMSASMAIEKSIDFTVDTEGIRDSYVYSDELHANEVLINLISNAVKYTPEGGKVHLKAEQLGTDADGKAIYRFEVKDNGIGMSEEFQKHLFETFSREKTSTVSKQEGAGLGLSIVKKIVDLAGGTITVSSRQNRGSSFTVQLPMRIMEPEAIQKFEAENASLEIHEAAFSFKNRKVLLVEDNEMNREIAVEILEETGLLIDAAEDGALAVKAVREKGATYYDFILMDIQMPVMDGYEATRNIRALPGGDKVTIIALSANAFEEDVQRSLACGMNAHVAKPIDVKKLFETMQGLLG